MATLQERHPTPTWLPESSQALFRKGLAAITSPEFLQTPGRNHSHFLLAYCALTMAGFQREHLQLVCDARIAASFGLSMVAPLLMGNTSEVQTYILTMSSPVGTQRGPTSFQSNGLGPRSLPLTMILFTRRTIKTFTANSLVTLMICINDWLPFLLSWQAMTCPNHHKGGLLCPRSVNTPDLMCRAM